MPRMRPFGLGTRYEPASAGRVESIAPGSGPDWVGQSPQPGYLCIRRAAAAMARWRRSVSLVVRRSELARGLLALFFRPVFARALPFPIFFDGSL